MRQLFGDLLFNFQIIPNIRNLRRRLLFPYLGTLLQPYNFFLI